MEKRASKIIYFGLINNFFNLSDSRCYSPAAQQKSEYIIDCINQIGFSVDVISGSWSSQSNGFFPAKVVKQGLKKYVYFASFGANTKIGKFFRKYLMIVNVFLYFLFGVKRKSKIFIYHSIPYQTIFIFLKKIKKFVYIYEIEEIYSNAIKTTRSQFKNEKKIISVADSYIISNDLFEHRLKTNKPKIVLYGCYHSFYDDVKKFSSFDNKIHLVYSGTFDFNKGGCINSIKIMERLDEKYVLHVLGFGKNFEKEMIIQNIHSHNSKYNSKIVFDGLLQGKEYTDFLQKCDVGICLQNSSNSFSDTSFPSKLLIYMGCGLKIISSNDKCLTQSLLKNHLIFTNIDLFSENLLFVNKDDSRAFIKNLHLSFLNKLKEVLYD